LATEGKLEVLAIDVLHGNKRHALVLVDLMDGADVRMAQGRRRARLEHEPLECLLVVSHLLGQELQRYKTAKLGVFGLVDHTHPTAPELVDDFVMRDGLPDHYLPPLSRGKIPAIGTFAPLYTLDEKEVGVEGIYVTGVAVVSGFRQILSRFPLPSNRRTASLRRR
jgi:hypothetical protein